MPTINDNFENHVIHITITNAIASIESIKNMSEIDELRRDCLDRFDRVINEIIRSLESADAYFVNFGHLTNINNSLNAIITNASNFKSNKNLSHIDNINSQLENIVVYMRYINPLATNDDIVGLREHIVALRRSVGAHRSNINKKYDDSIDKMNIELNKVNESFDELKKSIDSEKQRIDSFVSTGQELINNIQAKYLESSEFRMTDFKKLLESLENDFDLFIKENKKKHEEIISRLSESQEKFKSDTEIKTLEYMEKLKENETEVEKIVGALSINGLASGYKKEADNERKAQIIWQSITLAFISILIWFSIGFVNSFKGLESPTVDISWTLIVSRLIVVSALGTAFGYSAKQASSHSRGERYNRLMQLELASINSYLAVLPKENQYKVKEELTDKLFGKAEILLQQKDNDEDLNKKNIIINQDILKDALSIFKK